MTLRFLPLLAAPLLLLGTALSGEAQTLAADYQVQDTYASSVGTIGPLAPTGTVAFVSDVVDGNTQEVVNIKVTEIGSPLSPSFVESGVQTQTNPFISSSNYSIVLLANFSLNPLDAAATKIFDFKNLSSDAGLYVNTTSGTVAFYDGAGMLQGSGGAALSALAYTQIVLTRDGTTGEVNVYEDGVLAFTFTDSSGLAILGDASASGDSFLTLFKDDGTGVGGTVTNENTQGNIARLRLYDGTLTAEQVAALDRSAVPEPGTWALLLLGGTFAAAKLRRRK